ncbi:hypothetical protein [Micromonospora sp. NPDC048830]|uniref:hypothetical protein n=1 Tax=Micromonospora sp. NPDC048830 TaxID=3364257 RepID=UPI0037122D4E
MATFPHPAELRMHRSLSSLTQRIERALDERLIPAIYRNVEPVHVEAAHLPGEPIPAGEGLALAYTPFAVGQPWGPAWTTTWFRFTGEVPARMRGHRVELLVDLGFDNAGPGFRSEGSNTARWFIIDPELSYGIIRG